MFLSPRSTLPIYDLSMPAFIAIASCESPWSSLTCRILSPSFFRYFLCFCVYPLLIAGNKISCCGSCVHGLCAPSDGFGKLTSATQRVSPSNPHYLINSITFYKRFPQKLIHNNLSIFTSKALAIFSRFFKPMFFSPRSIWPM